MVKLGTTLHLCRCLPWARGQEQALEQVLEQACLHPCDLSTWLRPLGSTVVPSLIVCRNWLRAVRPALVTTVVIVSACSSV